MLSNSSHSVQAFHDVPFAENGSAEQVTTLADGENDPQRCIDGNYFSECHTALGIEANTAYATWWRVYLNYIVRVTGIQIWNAAYIPEWRKLFIHHFAIEQVCNPGSIGRRRPLHLSWSAHWPFMSFSTQLTAA